MTDWELLEAKIEGGYFEQYNIGHSEIRQQHLKNYGDAFVKGFYSFDTEFLKNKTRTFNTPDDRQLVIFDYATGGMFKRSGFPETYGGKRHLLSGWVEAGKEAGWFYRAWYIIIEHSHRFEPMFRHDNSISRRFIDHFIEGIAILQRKDDREEFISLLKAGGQKDEGKFREWFHTFFGGGGYEFIEAEGAQGTGRIDLRVKDKAEGVKTIEFKGWWNSDSKEIIDQVVQYLTDFEEDGYIFMINNLKKKDILLPYKKLVTAPGADYVFDSWQTVKYRNTGFEYYISKHHKHNRVKTVYHFIYRLFP